MIVLRNARILPELTEGFEGTSADIVIETGLLGIRRRSAGYDRKDRDSRTH